MRPILIFLLAGLAGLFVQSTLVHSSMPTVAAPDFILILVVYVSRTLHTPWGALAAFALGLLADFGSAQYLGPNAGGCLIAFAVVGLIANRVYADKVIALFVITFVCSIVKSCFALLMLYVYVNEFTFAGDVFRMVLIEALLSGLISPLVMRALGKRASGASRSTGRFQASPIFRWS